MRLAGLQKLTLLDYPGEVACTVFTKGCNLRCPFCHNPELVLGGMIPAVGDNVPFDTDCIDAGQDRIASGQDFMPEGEFLDFLNRRRGRLSGVVVSGGEPTIQADLPDFLERIRRMGFLVKLDTNGLNPEMLRVILDRKLADYVAMDIKNSPGKYAKTCGLSFVSVSSEVSIPGCESILSDENISTDESSLADEGIPTDKSSLMDEGFSTDERALTAGTERLWERVSESISILRHYQTPGEFRTTVVLGLHTDDDILEMAGLLPPDRAWYLQQFIDSGNLVGSYKSGECRGQSRLSSPPREDLERMKMLAGKIRSEVYLRGV